MKNSIQFEVNSDERLKMLILSDLHISKQRDLNNIEKLMLKLQNIKYDAICLVGDIIDSTNILRIDSDLTKNFYDFISYLGYLAPTYIVYGSHDLTFYNGSASMAWTVDKEVFQNKFLDKISSFYNINILENVTKDITGDYTISGVIPSLNYICNSKNNVKVTGLKLNVYDFLKELDSKKINTLLCHYPNFIKILDEFGYLANVGFSIAGHNHNGCTQWAFFPIEKILDLLNEKNRGFITPEKSFNLKDTKYLRGVMKLHNDNTLIINPAFKTLSMSAGWLEKLDCIFYRGYTEVEYIPKKVRKK